MRSFVLTLFEFKCLRRRGNCCSMLLLLLLLLLPLLLLPLLLLPLLLPSCYHCCNCW